MVLPFRQMARADEQTSRSRSSHSNCSDHKSEVGFRLQTLSAAIRSVRVEPHCACQSLGTVKPV